MQKSITQKRKFAQPLLIASLFSAVSSALLTGCGGSHAGPDSNNFRGRYTGTYKGATETGTFYFTSDKLGHLTARFESPSAPSTFGGTGNIDTSGNIRLRGSTQSNLGGLVVVDLTGVVSSQNDNHVVTGTFQGTTTSGNDRGSFTGQEAPATNPFAGNYTGTYSGGENGTLKLSVNNDGIISATAQSPSAGTITGSGIVDQVTGQFVVSLPFVANQKNQLFTVTGTFSGSNGASGQYNATTGLNGPVTIHKQ